MKEIRNVNLYSRDSKGKIRILNVKMIEDTEKGVLYIQRKSGIIDGKLIDQPVITVTKGKVKRTLLEQAELEMNSIINKQKDKGYIESEETDSTTIDLLIPIIKSDSSGNTKPMLAKDPKSGSKPKEKEFFDDKEWFISYKLDGLRCKGVLNNDKTKINFYTRTGKLLKGSVNNFQFNKVLIDFMKKYNCEIDGEIYKHNVPLNKISGDVRKEDYVMERHDYLEYHIFDCPDSLNIASERFRRLEELQESLGLNRHIFIVDHKKVTNYKDIMTFHDAALVKGYEGAMVQLQDSLYEFGKRSSNMWKIKLFQDAEFKIVGYKLGLRGAEDMCFIMELEDGRTFEAKPQGDKELKDFYIDNFSDIESKMGTVKFFNYTEYGIPNLPSFKCVREE